MRSVFRKAAAVCASACLICFCSCERHHANELPAELEHATNKAAEHEHAAGEIDKHHHERGDTQARATMSVTPPPAGPSPTPAEFFPQSTPR